MSGENGSFQCQHCLTDDINWLLNGTKLHKYSDMVQEDVMLFVGYSSQPYCGLQFTLVMRNIGRYNNTFIQCQANIAGSVNLTSHVILLVQGINRSIVLQ